jgi:parvulin-like peptidyl-prolyl isomerase
MKRSLLFMPILLAVAAGPVCADKTDGAEPATTPKEVLARVNGIPVYRRDLDRRLIRDRSNAERTDGSDKKPVSAAAQRSAARKLRSDTLESLIDRELLNLEAVRRNTEISEEQIEAHWAVVRRGIRNGNEPADTDEVARRMALSGFTPEQYKEDLRKQARIRALKQQMLPPADTIGEKEIARCYKEYRPRFIVPERVRIREILVPIRPPGDKAAVDVAEGRMKEIKSRLSTGSDFGQLVREYSAARSALSGGDIGWKSRGQLAGELGNLAFTLKEGEVGGPVRMQAGLVIIKAEEKQAERVYTLEEARANIVKFLQQKNRDSEIEKLISKLRKSAKIEYVVIP